MQSYFWHAVPMDNEVDYYEWVWDVKVITLPNCSLGCFFFASFQITQQLRETVKWSKDARF